MAEGTITRNAEYAMDDIGKQMQEHLSKQALNKLIRSVEQKWEDNKSAAVEILTLRNIVEAFAPELLRNESSNQQVVNAARTLSKRLPSQDDVNYDLWELMMKLAKQHVYATAYIERALNAYGVPEAKDENVSLRVRILRQLLAALPRTRKFCSKSLQTLPVDQVTEDCFLPLDNKVQVHRNAMCINEKVSKLKQGLREEEYLLQVYPDLRDQLANAGPKRQEELVQAVGAADLQDLPNRLAWCAGEAEVYTGLERFWNKDCTVRTVTGKELEGLFLAADLTVEEFVGLCAVGQCKDDGIDAITAYLLERAETVCCKDPDQTKAAMQELTGIYYRLISQPYGAAVWATLVKQGRDVEALLDAVKQWKGHMAAASPDKWFRMLLEALFGNDTNGYRVLQELTQEAVQNGCWQTDGAVSCRDPELSAVLVDGIRGQVRLLLLEMALMGTVTAHTAMELLRQLDDGTALCLYHTCVEKTGFAIAMQLLTGAAPKERTLTGVFAGRTSADMAEKISALCRSQRLLLYVLIALAGKSETKINNALSFVHKGSRPRTMQPTFLKRLSDAGKSSGAAWMAQLLAAVLAGDVTPETAGYVAGALQGRPGACRIFTAWMCLLDRTDWDRVASDMRGGCDAVHSLLKLWGCSAVEADVLEQQLQLLGTWTGAPKMLEQKLLHRSLVSDTIREWSAKVAKDRGKEVQHYKNDAIYIGCADQLASGRIYTGGSSSENLYLLAFALDFTYDSENDDKNNIRCLFEDYQTSNLRRYIEKGSSKGEKEPCVYINKKNYVEVVYLYYLCSREGTPEQRFLKARQTIDRLTEDADKNGSYVTEDRYDTKEYKTIFEQILQMDETAMELTIKEKFARGRKTGKTTRGAIELSRSAGTAQALYEGAVEELKKNLLKTGLVSKNEEPLEQLRQKAETSLLADEKLRTYFVDSCPDDDNADPDQVSFVLLMYKLLALLRRVTVENVEDVSRTAILVVQFWNAYLCSMQLPCETLSKAYVRLGLQAGESLENAGYPSLNVKNSLDVLLCFLLYLLINSAPLFSEG